MPIFLLEHPLPSLRSGALALSRARWALYIILKLAYFILQIGNHLSFYSQNNFRGNTNKDEKKKDNVKEDKRKDTTRDKEVNPLPLWSQTGSEDKTSPNKRLVEALHLNEP